MRWINQILKVVRTNSFQQKKQKQFGYLIFVAFIVYLGISIYKSDLVFNNKQIVATAILCVNFLVLFFAARLYFPILFIWLLFGEILGKITSTIVLGIVYFLVFTPITLILNLINKKHRYKSQWFRRVDDSIDYKNLN